MWGLIAAGLATGFSIWSGNEAENKQSKLMQKQAIANAQNAAVLGGVARDFLLAAGIAAGVLAVGAIVTAE